MERKEKKMKYARHRVIYKSLKANLYEDERMISELQKENLRLLNLVWKGYPNIYRRLPRDIHLKILTYLDQRRLDVLEFSGPINQRFICMKKQNNDYILKFHLGSKFKEMFSTNRRGYVYQDGYQFHQLVAIFQDWKCNWKYSTNPEHDNIENCLLQLGTKRVTRSSKRVMSTRQLAISTKYEQQEDESQLKKRMFLQQLILKE